MSATTWRVVLNGRLPALRVFASFDEAVEFVSGETGETREAIIANHKAGCPTETPVTGSEFDIEEVKS